MRKTFTCKYLLNRSLKVKNLRQSFLFLFGFFRLWIKCSWLEEAPVLPDKKIALKFYFCFLLKFHFIINFQVLTGWKSHSKIKFQRNFKNKLLFDNIYFIFCCWKIQNSNRSSSNRISFFWRGFNLLDRKHLFKWNFGENGTFVICLSASKKTVCSSLFVFLESRNNFFLFHSFSIYSLYNYNPNKLKSEFINGNQRTSALTT